MNDDFKKIECVPLAETWECSTHPDGPSRLSDCESLRDAIRSHPEWLGTHPLQVMGGKPELPILLKLIHYHVRSEGRIVKGRFILSLASTWTGGKMSWVCR